MKEKIILLLLLFLPFAGPLMAQGDLMIFPKRIVFEGIQNRTQNINLSNVGKDTATYKLSYSEIKMDQDGKFIAIEEPETDQHFASPYLRFYPRMVTLAPNESQTVKIQLIKTDELQQGEYRSHLYFRAVPKNKVLEKEDPAHKPEGLSISITPVFGISIANVITIGESTTAVTLSNLVVERSEDGITLSLDFNRNGNRSCYGDIQVNHISAAGITTSAASVKGFAVYTPGILRRTKMKLSTVQKTDYTKGQLQVIYSAQDKGKKYAEATLRL
ncbi:molecular chaperone [Flavobacterium sp. ZE23DGlu08]|uniref:molecular chaperone n=1 Tax=Flavobacterium sp. ZE23DGlu08 TaxID=3059026 RepID=UPI00265F7CFC|nr:molecular chaperone [Flavobacterium sp. ZE23DGlu08]WKL43878.1 molecular chaperone [Flavobacterium sp. ZE23DGlu08]